jgi:molecular chaperone HtpG
VSSDARPQPQRFQAEVSQVLSLVVNSLYSHKEIFLRELVSNAADALDRLRFEAIQKPELVPEGYVPVIRLIPDAAARTLTIWDNGIGMGEGDLARNLGTVARSGTRDFADRLREAQAQSDVRLIGQFGVGFYSGYLVADRIEVVSRAAGSADAFRWSSDGKDTFTVEPAERECAGTSVLLHLAPEHAEYLDEWRLRDLVRRYSDFISHKIELRVTGAGEGDAAGPRFEAINEASALWTRPEKDVTEEQYTEFYKHLSHEWQPPLARTHFRVEGTQMFTGLLFIPKQPPLDWLTPDARHGVRLYVRRVFIMEDCEELLPRWLRFVRGVIDSDDLPLNVSRELLQDSTAVQTIKKQVIRRVLDALTKLAEDKPDDYAEFWRKFGAVLKEGLHVDPAAKDRIAKLLRYETSTSDGALVSLADYVARMKDGQAKIYYALGPNRSMLASSPHLEGLKARGYEVLFMTDGVDQWAVDGLGGYDGKALAHAMEEGLDLDEGKAPDPGAADSGDAKESASGTDAGASGEFASLCTRCQEVLDAHVSEVRMSRRLTDSPACLVVPKGGLAAHLERMIRAYQKDLPVQKRILELNPTHPLVVRLRDAHAKDAASAGVRESIEMLYDQALLSEGSPLPDPARFAARVTALMAAQG